MGLRKPVDNAEEMRMKALTNPLGGEASATRDSDGGAAAATGPRRTRTVVRLARFRFATDAAMLLVAAAVETLLAPAADVSSSPGWRLAFVGLVLLFLALRGSYRARIGQRYLEEARTIVTATALAAMIITFIRVTFTDNPHVAEESIRSWLFAGVYLLVGRACFAMVSERANVVRAAGAPTIILGAGNVGHLVARRLLAHPELGLRPVGFVDPDPLEVDRPSGLPVLGSDQDLEEVVRQNGIEHAIVSFSSAPHDAQLRISRALQRMKVSVSIIPRLFEGVPDKIGLERVGGLPLVTIYPSDPHDWRVSVKYTLDRIAAAIGIVIVSPLLLIAAVGTLLTLGRPLFFKQRRVGLDGREFDMLKFRTMRGSPDEHGEADAEWAASQLEGVSTGKSSEESLGKEAPESRATRFGNLLRRTSLDELPQLFNVLKGEMSMVGPRPERSSYVAMFQEQIRRYTDRHQVKSGITGWAQVHGLRGDTSLSDRIEWDNYYIENWSPWLDVKILLLTVVTVFKGFAK
jgi:exopolysaccharide biosynthesis polyprenyl glycosylphosphotransferase